MSKAVEEHNIKCLPGYCFIEVDVINSIGDIIIPDIRRKSPLMKGKCIQWEPYRGGCKSEVFNRGRRIFKDASCWNPIYKGLEGSSVVFTSGRQFNIEDKTFWLVRLEHIEAFIPETVSVVKDEATPDRCNSCSTIGEANIMLGGDGYCPKCGLNHYGQNVRDKDAAAIDRELHDYMLMHDKRSRRIRKQG